MQQAPLPLIHPIYLDVPMLFSFAAALQGGLSFGAEVTSEQGASTTDAIAAKGKLGIGNLFNCPIMGGFKPPASAGCLSKVDWRE